MSGCSSHSAPNNALNPSSLLEPQSRFGGNLGQITWSLSALSPKRDWSSKGVNPLRTAFPFWGQTSQITTSLPPKRDCIPKNCSPRRANGLHPRFRKKKNIWAWILIFFSSSVQCGTRRANAQLWHAPHPRSANHSGRQHKDLLVIRLIFTK